MTEGEAEGAAARRLLVHVRADLRVVVGDAVEERGRHLPHALLAVPLLVTHRAAVAHRHEFR
eukprot:scaffold84027_cov54-Phaeocystis_antarctica.AAC.1